MCIGETPDVSAHLRRFTQPRRARIVAGPIGLRRRRFATFTVGHQGRGAAKPRGGDRGPPFPQRALTPMSFMTRDEIEASGIDLYWLPLGAGGHSVRLNGLVFEAIAARLAAPGPPTSTTRRSRSTCRRDGRDRAGAGVGRERRPGRRRRGSVGTRAAGRFRLFRYEVRRWRDGVIPDLAEAVESPRRLSDDRDLRAAVARARAGVADASLGSRRAAHGRDVELELAHLLAVVRSGLDVDSIRLPRAGAPRLARRGPGGPPAAGGSDLVRVFAATLRAEALRLAAD